MEKTYKRFLCLLLAFTLVIGIMPMGALAAEGDNQPALTVTARYMTNRLTWNADGTSYAIERSEDGITWEQVGTSASGSWLDNNADLGTQYYYRLTKDNNSTEAVQGAVTGMAALKEIAVLFYAGNDEVACDGSNKVVIADGDKAAELNAMNSGTILYKAYFNALSGSQAVLGTDSGCFVGANGNKFRSGAWRRLRRNSQLRYSDRCC